MKRRSFLASGSAAFLAARAPAGALTIKAGIADRLTTRAEASNYAVTTSSAEVTSFLNALDARGAPIVRGSLGDTHEGRPIPYAIASRPMVSTPAEARDLGRPVVLLVGGLHGGEVEGKEALLALLRDLCVSTERTLLEDLVLVFVPVLNPDGNDAFGAEAINRPTQNGPARVGTAATGNQVDLDDDFVKLEAPETRGLLAFVRAWQPHVFVDARTSDGSFHDFGVTYAPSLHPAAYYGGRFVRERIMPAIRKNLHEKFSIEGFSAGHFGRSKVFYSPPPIAEIADFGWFADDDRPRSATNYMGVRGIAAIRVNGFSHDVLERRIYNVRATIESILGYCSDNDDAIVASYATSTRWLGGKVPVRSAFPKAASQQSPIVWENLALASVPSDEPGMPPGFKRTGFYSTTTMPIFDRYDGTTVVEQRKGYLVPYEHVAHVKPILDRHGIVSETLVSAQRFEVQDFVVERIEHEPPIGNRRPTTIAGHWQPKVSYASRFGALFVPCGQPLGPLVSLLLEPESEDGIIVWNSLDTILRVGYSVPIFRVYA